MTRFLLGILAIFLVMICYFTIMGFFIYQGRPTEIYRCEGCNLLIITIDTLRADHVSSYGYFQKTSPFIDSFAKKGIIFTRAFAQIPHTPPSHWCIFTGLYPYKHNKYSTTDNGTGVITLSDILKENEYITAAFTSSRMLHGFKHEFDYFNPHIDKKRSERPYFINASETTRAVLSWLENHSGEKFFLWVHYFDPHSPYEPPEEYDIYNYNHTRLYSDERYSYTGLSKKRSIREDMAKYDGEIRYTDIGTGHVLNKLKEIGMENSTLIIILSDHGECFGEHNFSDFGYEENEACVFHGKTLYDQEVHVPLIVRNPNSSLTGLRIDTLIETVDIVPTVLDTLNIKYPLETDGESIVPLLAGEKRKKDYVILQTRPKKSSFSIGIRTNKWKFINMRPSSLDMEEDIAEQEGKTVEKKEQEKDHDLFKKLLFRPNDGEITNHFENQKTIAEQLEIRLRDIVSFGVLPVIKEIDKETEDMLRSLGYMQ